MTTRGDDDSKSLDPKTQKTARLDRPPKRQTDWNQLHEVVDPSIVRMPLFWTQDDKNPEATFLHHYRSPVTKAKAAFWNRKVPGSHGVPLRGEWLPKCDILKGVDTAAFEKEFNIVSDERIQAIEGAQTLNTDQVEQYIPYQVTDQMSDCVPQFTLRNIARLTHTADPEEPVRFAHTPPAMPEINALIEEARTAEIPEVEFNETWSTPLMNDFRVFLEEVLYLCPWETMPKGRDVPGEDSLWNEKHSQATLTYDLINKSGQVLIWGHDGGPGSFGRGGGRMG